jgi:hypothetical protein
MRFGTGFPAKWSARVFTPSSPLRNRSCTTNRWSWPLSAGNVTHATRSQRAAFAVVRGHETHDLRCFECGVHYDGWNPGTNRCCNRPNLTGALESNGATAIPCTPCRTNPSTILACSSPSSSRTGAFQAIWTCLARSDSALSAPAWMVCRSVGREAGGMTEMVEGRMAIGTSANSGRPWPPGILLPSASQVAGALAVRCVVSIAS